MTGRRRSRTMRALAALAVAAPLAGLALVAAPAAADDPAPLSCPTHPCTVTVTRETAAAHPTGLTAELRTGDRVFFLFPDVPTARWKLPQVPETKVMRLVALAQQPQEGSVPPRFMFDVYGPSFWATFQALAKGTAHPQAVVPPC